MELEEIIKDVKTKMSEKRFNHSVGVMERAEVLAKIYNVDTTIAKKVGIAHDIAKEMPAEEKLSYVKENNIEITEIERNHIPLLHGKIGADMAKKLYGFDINMQKAIEYHTTGNIDMDILSKIIYIADKTEDGRKGEKYDIQYIRKLSEESLNKAMVFLLEAMMKECMERKSVIDNNSVILRNKLILEK